MAAATSFHYHYSIPDARGCRKLATSPIGADGATGMTKRIGLLTSGGDRGGLNAVIRAVALRAASAYRWEVLGIRNGSMGFCASRPMPSCSTRPSSMPR